MANVKGGLVDLVPVERLFAILVLACACFSLRAEDEDEREGTREQVESKDNVTILCTDCETEDGGQPVMVFDKDNPDEQWRAFVRVKFHPRPEKEFILKKRKYNWTVSEGFTIDDPEAARPGVKAKPEAAGKEGRLKLRLQWEEERIGSNEKPSGETKLHPWSNDKASMRLIVPEFELCSVSYNLGDNGEKGALPFYDNSDKPQLIRAPEYVKNGQTREVGVLYRGETTPEFKIQFTCKPTSVRELSIYAKNEEGILSDAELTVVASRDGKTSEARLLCLKRLPRAIKAGKIAHSWKIVVCGRALEVKGENSTTDNVFVVLNRPFYRHQPPWIDCMVYAVRALGAKGAQNEYEILKRIVPNFRCNASYPSGSVKSQLRYDFQDLTNPVPTLYHSYVNITSLFKSDSPEVNCYDSALSIYVLSQYLGSLAGQVNFIQKDPWIYWDPNQMRWRSTRHTYNTYDCQFVFDPTPVWSTEEPENGIEQEGILSEREFFIRRGLQNANETPLGEDFSYSVSW